MAEARTCPQCGAELSPDTPQGLCPRCLLEAGLSSESGSISESEPTLPATPGGLDRGGSAVDPSSVTLPSRGPKAESEVPGAFPEPAPGAKLHYFGDYEILEEIARGGMGVVYKGRQVSLNRTVALKMILAGQLASEDDVRRFHTEAEAAANLQHPNIVAIHEVGQEGGQHYFSMDYVEGTNLAELVRDNPLPAKRAARYVAIIARAIHYAHEQGTLHRDLKPSNVLVDGADQPRITDFGLAKRVEGDSQLTAPGQLLGTPSYMPPEQASAKHGVVGPHSDVYSLGAILYELSTGRPPFRGETAVDTLMQVIESEPISPRLLNPKLPIDLETICLKCLQKEADKRYASAAGLADDLDRFLSGEPIRARPITAWERALKWATRRPAVAAMAAMTLVVTIAGFTGVTWQWRETKKAWTTAQVKADDEARARGWAEREKKRADDQRGIAEARARELAVQKKRIREELHRSNLLGGRLLLQDGNVTDAERVLWREYLTRPQVDDRRAHWALWKLYRERPRADALSLSAEVIELSADGMLLVTAQGAAVSVLDVKTKSVVANFRSQHGPVASLAISPDNSLLACGHVVPTVVVWRLHGGDAPLATLEPSGTVDIPLMLEAAATAQGQNVSGVRTSMTSLLRSRPSLRFLAAETLLVLNATEMSVWDVGEESLQSHVEYSGGVPGSSSRILGVSADGSVALTLRRVRPRSLDAWDLSKMEPGRQSLAAESGKLVLAAPPSSNPFLYAIEIARRRARKASGETKEAELLRPTNAALSRDGKLLVSQSSSGRLTLWDFVERERIAEHHDPDAPVPRLDRLEISPDGGLLAGVEGTKVWLWELPSLEPRPGFSLLARSVSQVKVSGDGKTLYVAEKDSPIGLYDLKEPDAIVVMRSGGGCDGLGPQGPAVVSRGGGSQQFPLEIWDSDERQTIARGNFLTTLGRSDKRIAISPDGTLAAIGTQGFGPAAVDFYDLGMLRRTEVVRLPSKGGVGGIAFSPDGARVAVVASGRTHIIDVISKEIVGTVKTEFYFYDGEVAFSPDGRVLAVSGGPMSKTAALEPQTGALDLFDLESRERLATLVIIKGLGAMEFSPDGAHLAVASDREIILLDSGNLDVLGRLVGHTGRVLSLSYAPDGSMIASGGADETLRLWDVAQREELLSLDLGEGEVQKVVFSPDGSRLRYSSTRRVVSLDLRAFDQHIHNNLVVQLTRLIPEVVEQEGRDEALRMVERLRDIHPQAFQRGMAELASVEERLPSLSPGRRVYSEGE